MPDPLPPLSRVPSAAYTSRPMLSVDNWAACEKVHQYYLAETARRKAAGLPTY